MPDVSYFKIFGIRCYIRKDATTGKFDSKGDEGICLGYSSKRKVYKWLNKATNTMIESESLRIDEFIDKNNEKRKKEPYDYKNNGYIYEYSSRVMSK